MSNFSYRIFFSFRKNPVFYIGRRAGFTLFELLIVIVIIATISTVTLVNYNSYLSAQSLQIATQKLNLLIRETQIYGIAVQGAGGTQTFPDAYGIHFDIDNPDPTKRIIVFADTYQSGGVPSYNPAPPPNGDTVISSFVVKAPVVFSEMCVNSTGVYQVDCRHSAGNTATLFFRRPDPEPLIKSSRDISKDYSYLKVTLENPENGELRDLYVWSSGLMSESIQIPTKRSGK